MKIYCFRVQRYKKYAKQANNIAKKYEPMSWVEEIVSKELIERCPYECKVNEKALKGITKGLIRTGGVCPCAHPEWDENTPHEDKLCPCKTFRETKDCHCNLYI